MVVMTQEDSKFAHLLEPIRDLASNWDVNIADELEDYLEVLEAVKFSFEDGPSLNFAEAALVIQGSACVYSKKVEYLHKLVYQALEFIAEKKQREATRDATEQGDDPDDEFDDEETFLNLDDFLEEGQGIDMDDAESAQVALPLRPPAAILAMDDTRHGQGDGEAGQYKIASFSVHHSGALLLESRDGDTLDASLRRTASRMSSGGADGQGFSHMQQGSVGGGPSSEGAAEGPPQGANMSDDDDPGGGGGPDWDDDGAGPAYDADGDFPHDDGTPWQQGFEGDAGGAAAQAALAPSEEEFDPWKPLDMHEKGSLPIRPFRKARRTTARRRQQAAASAAGAHTLGLFTVAPPVPTGNGLSFPEFAGALRLQQVAKQQALRYEAEHSRGAGRHAAVLAEMQDNAYGDGADYDDDDGGGGHDGYGYDGGIDDDDDRPDIPPYDPQELENLAAAGGSNLPSGGGGGGGGESYEDLCKAHIDAFMHAAAAAEVQTELASRVAGWRHKILPLIEEQDAREAFHIHNYGDRILDRLTQLSLGSESDPSAATLELPAAPVALASVLSHTDQWEISRMFASLLQLVNAGNVGLQRPGLEGLSNSPVQLQLLSLELQHTQMLGFKAPSLHDKAVTATQRASKTEVQEAPAAGEENQGAAAVPVPKVSKRRKGSNR